MAKHCNCFYHRKLLVSAALQSARAAEQSWQQARLAGAPADASPMWEISTDVSRLRTFTAQFIQEASQ